MYQALIQSGWRRIPRSCLEPSYHTARRKRLGLDNRVAVDLRASGKKLSLRGSLADETLKRIECVVGIIALDETRKLP